MPSHLRTKFDKKAIRCIFIGYDSQRKGWRCCDPNTEKCYTSRNVVFDEASSWWTSQSQEPPDSKEVEVKLQKVEEQISEECQIPKIEEVQDEGEIEPTQSPWQTGVHQKAPEEIRHQQDEEETSPYLRRSSRQRKQNPKYANAALAEEANPRERTTRRN